MGGLVCTHIQALNHFHTCGRRNEGNLKVKDVDSN